MVNLEEEDAIKEGKESVTQTDRKGRFTYSREEKRVTDPHWERKRRRATEQEEWSEFW